MGRCRQAGPAARSNQLGDGGSASSPPPYVWAMKARTDGLEMSDDAVQAVRAFIAQTYGGGPDALPPSPSWFERAAGPA